LDNSTTFDLIVIGTGTSGSTTAARCRAIGWKVAIIDSLPFGGTCALRGCEPKKVLVEASKIIDSNQRHENKGISNSKGIHIHWSDLYNFKRTFTESFPKHREDSYIKAGIVPFHGHAKFSGVNKVKVEYNGGSCKDYNNNNSNTAVLDGKYILIATGAKPMNLNIPGSENIITSDQFLEFENDHLPAKIAFVGGGYISFEFAHIAAHAGCKNVTILHHGKQPLEHFDPDLVNQIVQKSQDIGIDIKLQTTVTRIDRSSSSSSSSEYNDGKLVMHSCDVSSTLNDNGKITTLKADMVVHGAGRVPNIEGLDLIKGDVDSTARGIRVNKYLQSVSNPIVYAAGDVADSGGSPLTPVASYDGNLVANNLLNGNIDKTNYKGLSSVVFTIPALASVGLQEKEAKEQGFRFKINHKNTSSWYSSRRVGETCSGFKILIEEDTDRILGAHIVGPHSEEIINIFSIAIRLGFTTKDLNDPLLYSYPTNSSDIVYML
jgi:glutathione reductase (NADPH)